MDALGYTCRWLLSGFVFGGKMIIIQLMGGLGNQLQQYALYKRLELNKIEVALDTSWFDDDNQKNMAAPRKLELDELMGITYRKADLKDVSKLIGDNGIGGKLRRHFLKNSIQLFEENGQIYVSSLIDGILCGEIRDLYLRGYFACDKYYCNIFPVLRKEIGFDIEKCNNKADVIKRASEMKNCNSVSVHLRRGDYLDSINQEMFGGICTEAYYTKCIQYINDKLSTPTFYIFSDDLDYAQEFCLKMRTLNPDLVFCEVDENRYNANSNDIYLMSCCRHNITANSTFSFWGARLNNNADKIIIRPTRHRNDHVFEPDIMKELWQDWTFVSPEGELYER